MQNNNQSLIKLGIDLGYSGYCKIVYQDKMYKFQISLDYFQEHGIEYGANPFLEFEGEKIVLGNSNETNDSFSTTEYKFLKQYYPLIIFYIIRKLGLIDFIDRLDLRIGLALIDWNKRIELLDRLKHISIKDHEDNQYDFSLNNITLYTQGQGCGKFYVVTDNEGKYPYTMLVIDIGYNTINLLYFENGKPVTSRCKPLPGHGISTIINPFKNYLETKFSMNFSEAEAINIFIQGSLKMHGVDVPEIKDEIVRLKTIFIQKLMKSLMVTEKKGLALVETVLFSGGGTYYIKDAKFPPNFVYNSKGHHEFENVLGYYYDNDFKNTVKIINGEIK